MQVLPSTRRYVETVLLRHHVHWTVSGGIQVGVVYLRELLREFHGNVSLALAGWYQGPASVRRQGVLPGTQTFVATTILFVSLEETALSWIKARGLRGVNCRLAL